MNRCKILFILLLIPILGSTQSNQADALKLKLFDLPDVHFEITKQTEDGIRVNLKIKQAIDHDNPELGFFYQNAVLLHKGFEHDIIMNTNGYAQQSGPTELIDLFDANYISIEHRYFGSSNPEIRDWKHLNLKNVTADLHHINRLFREIYSGSWISSGISKGGQTTIYYRYFYPDDVDLSIPYVAPLNKSLADERIYEFLDEVGSEDCREKIKDFQMRMLKQREEVLPLLYWHSKGANMSFTYMNGIEAAFEYAILEYPFSFWQYGSDCERIPSEEEGLEQNIDHFNEVVGLAFYSDAMVSNYAPHYYQAATEMGYYSFETDDFDGLIRVLPEEPSAIFAPKEIEYNYDASLNKKVIKWIKNEAEGMMFIYGASDTWTATGVDIDSNENLHMYMMDGKHHGNARVKNMDEEMKMNFLNIANSYLKDE